MSSDGPPEKQAGIRTVSALRISTDDAAGRAVDEPVSVVREVSLTLDVQGVESYTLLCTPGDELALAAGFLLSEGIIDAMADVDSLKACDEDPSVIRARLVQHVPRIHDAGRNLLIVSSCGLCGAAGLDAKLRALPAVGDTLRIDRRVLRLVELRLRDRQPLFRACGGTHAAGVFDADGALVSTAEDAGRHNALDKAIGRCLLEGICPAGRGVVLSSRVSVEMVGKAARAGIELICAVSAPTSLAIEVAERCGITLCSFVRETRATVFTHARRVDGASSTG